MSLHLGVSRKTVRAAIADLIRAGVIVQSPERRVRTVAAPSQRAHVSDHALDMLSNTVVIVGADDVSRAPMSQGWDASIQFNAARFLDQSAYHVLTFNPNGRSENDFANLARLRPAGLLLAYDMADSPRGQAVLAEAARHGVPAVAHGDAPAVANYDHVASDHEQGAYELTRFLIEKGRRRILRFWYVPGEPQWLQQRDRGYERAMAEAGLSPLPAARLSHLGAMEPWGPAEFRHVAHVLAGYLCEFMLGLDPPDALMLATDRHAFAVAAALRLLGKTPNRDVLLVGYDHTVAECVERAWETCGPVATIEKHNAEIARAMVQILLDRIAGRLPPEPQRVVIRPTFIILTEMESQTQIPRPVKDPTPA